MLQLTVTLGETARDSAAGDQRGARAASRTNQSKRPMQLVAMRDDSEPGQLAAAAYISSKVEVTPSGRAPLATRVARLELDRLRMI